MIKKAIITVKSNISADEDDLIEVVTPGYFHITDGGFRAEYTETKISGMEGTETSIIIRENSFELIRKGSTETKMEFDYRKESIALYKTPYGVMDVNIYTRKLDINMTENGGSLSVDYILTIGGEQTLNTYLTIDIKINNN